MKADQAVPFSIARVIVGIAPGLLFLQSFLGGRLCRINGHINPAGFSQLPAFACGNLSRDILLCVGSEKQLDGRPAYPAERATNP